MASGQLYRGRVNVYVCVCTGRSMASGQLSREEALACVGCRHACHILLYADTEAQLFEEIPIRHIVLVREQGVCVHVLVISTLRTKSPGHTGRWPAIFCLS